VDMGVKDELQLNRGRHRKSTAGRAASYRTDSEFVNYELDKEQVGELRKWREDIDDVLAIWCEVLEEGYRVNTKYDNYSSSFACFILPDVDSDNSGYILTGRGGNPYRAVCEALFKHHFLLSGGWGTYPTRQRLADDPDF